MRYVDAGYAVALVTLGAYAVSLVARRRRWERAYEASEDPSSYPDHPDPGLDPDPPAGALAPDPAGTAAAAVRRERS